MTGEDRTREALEHLIAVMLELRRLGLVAGTAGNGAVRLPDGTIALTPTAFDYAAMTPDDLVVCAPDGAVVAGHREPTTEVALHLAVLGRHPELGACLHCHPVQATAFALVGAPIPAVVEEFVLAVGGDVPVTEHAETGTPALAAAAVAPLADRSAALLANHGLVTVGHDLAEALHVAVLVERTAATVATARTLGTVTPLPLDVVDRFAGRYRAARGGADR